MVGAERFAVHFVGDEDLGRRVSREGQGEGAHERDVVLAGVGEDRLEVIGAVVGALEPHVDAARRRLHVLEHVGQEGAGPARRGDGVIAPRLAGREWSHLEAAVAGTFESDRPLYRR